MKLITEMVDFNSIEVIQEGTKTDPQIKIRGPFIQAEIKNRNGRVYKKQLCLREIEKFNLEKIKTNKAVGELDHPESPQINLDRISHKILSLVMEGNDGIGEAKLLDTPMGKIAKALIKEGVVLGVSTRGLGSIAKNNIVNEDFKLITVDIVADPSAPGAFVDGILENKEYVIEGSRIVERAVEKMKRDLDNKGSKEILSIMLDFLDNVNNKI